MTPVQPIAVARFATIAHAGIRYRARIGRGRVIEIQDGRVQEDRGNGRGFLGGSARCLTWSQKRIVAIEEIVPPRTILRRRSPNDQPTGPRPADPAILAAIAAATERKTQ